jgi:hypothetical protein
MEGHNLHEVRDTSILKYPIFVYLSTDNKSMFVSDKDNRAVYKFTLQGDLISQNKTENNDKQAGLTVTNCGCADVCYPMKSDLLGVIVPGMRAIRSFNVQHVLKPHSINISVEQNKMIISESRLSVDCNFIKIFDIK